MLFTIGLEFSLERLLKAKKLILIGGGLQILCTIILVFISSYWLNIGWNSAIFLGFLLAISSTAILLKLLQNKNMLNSSLGKRVVGILVFQDLSVIPMILILPILENKGGNIQSVLIQIISTLVFLIGGVLTFRFIVNFIFPILIKNADKELSIVGIALLCFSLPLFAGFLNISLALGAFLAGLVVSETSYKHKVFHSLEELKDLFTCIFFVSIGLLFNVNFVWQNLVLVLFSTLGVLIINLLATTIALKSVHKWSESIIAAISLVQIGEFAFVLSKIGLDKNIISIQQYNIFLSVAIITMILTPFLLEAAHYLENRTIEKK